MQITAVMVKELRDRTGSGMMECKKSLLEANGDLELAIENMRKSGLAKADKKSGRVAAEGRVSIRISDDGNHAVILEINCETDFVSQGDDFIEFTDAVTASALQGKPEDIEALLQLSLSNGKSIEVIRQELVARIGENVQVRRFMCLSKTSGTFMQYIHGIRIGVLVELEGGDEETGKDVAMHISFHNPVCMSEDEVPADLLAKEKNIYIAQAEKSGKPAEIIEKMVQGKIKKYLSEITLLGQSFIKDPDKTVNTLLKEAGAKVSTFVRYEVGEGIEKKKENFADEVMAQVNAG